MKPDTFAGRIVRALARDALAEPAPRYPQLMVWVQAHGDQLRHEAERRGAVDLDTLLTYMLDDILPVYVDADRVDVEIDRDAMAPRSIPFVPVIPPNRGPWRQLRPVCRIPDCGCSGSAHA